RFELKAPDRDPLLAHHPARLPDGLEETRLLTLVYALHFPEQSEWRSNLLSDGDERRNVFWEPGAAVPDSSVQKIAPNTVIHSDPISHFFHIGATRFANRRPRDDVGNFHGQE